MHLFVTGGSGLTGPSVIRELLTAGHTVTGLARSDVAATRLAALGTTTRRGSLTDLDQLSAGAAASDGVIHLAFSPPNTGREESTRRDVAAINALGQALKGSGRPLLITSGTLAMPTGRISSETDTPDETAFGGYRIPGERAALALADHGVRSSVIRLAPTVHGPDDYGFVPAFVAAARKSGVSAYLGDGAQRWPAVHRLDAAVLFRLAAENAPAGTTLHGAAEGAVTLRSVAEQIGRGLGIPAVSMTFEEATAHFENASEHFEGQFLATIMGLDTPVSSDLTRSLLGWEPVHPTLLEDLASGDYI